nr:DNA cytosine methyltransferase [Rhizobium sp. Khangiran2]
MLQGFPRNYKFIRNGDKVSFATLGRLIGNAVPVPLGETIGSVLTEHVARIAKPILKKSA